jgi:hypothetical protein
VRALPQGADDETVLPVLAGELSVGAAVVPFGVLEEREQDLGHGQGGRRSRDGAGLQFVEELPGGGPGFGRVELAREENLMAGSAGVGPLNCPVVSRR